MEEVKQEGAVQTTAPEITKYEFGDMYVECSCGHEQLVAESVPGGVRFDVFTTDKHDIALVCTKCNTKLRLFFKEAANPPQPEEDEKTTDEGTDKGSTKSDESGTKPLQEPTTDANAINGGGEQEPLIESEKEVNNEPIPETDKAKA